MDYSPFSITRELYHKGMRVVGNVFKTSEKHAFTYRTHELWALPPQEMMKVRSISKLKKQFNELMEKRSRKANTAVWVQQNPSSTDW